MTVSTRIRLAVSTAATSIVLVLPAAAFAVPEYEPFVTDFPKTVQPAAPYVPWVTDFGRALPSAGPAESGLPRALPGDFVRAGVPLADGVPFAQPAGGFDWVALGIGMGAGLGLAALVAMLARTLRQRRTVFA